MLCSPFAGLCRIFSPNFSSFIIQNQAKISKIGKFAKFKLQPANGLRNNYLLIKIYNNHSTQIAKIKIGKTYKHLKIYVTSNFHERQG